MTPWLRRGSMAMVLTLLVGACGSATPTGSGTPSASAASPAASAEASGAPSTAPTSSATTSGPIASSGAIAMLASDGSLSIVDASGRSVVAAGGAGETYGFPTWSPDGSKVATVRTKGTDQAVVVVDAKDIVKGLPVPPVPIFDKAGVQPFYLFWSPDGQAVSFLATDGAQLALRLAPVDGSAPLDGSGPNAVVRTGNPIYYDWLTDDRLLAHVGTGKEGFLGQLGLDGTTSSPIQGTPADFRSAVVSHDRKSIAFVRATQGLDNEVVVTALDGSREARLSVVGPTAITFDPTGDTLASIGAADVASAASFPLGPLKLLDRAGKQRTLLDGLVAGFWWSPDGKTMAAIRIVEVPAAASPAPSPSGASAPPVSSGATPVPTPEPSTEIHLTFVDVASGRILSDPVISPSPTFINGVVQYFDQYALSHRLWSPDGTALLSPEVDGSGTERLVVRYFDGRPPVALDGAIGFWSP